MYILLLAPPTLRLYRVSFLTPRIAPSSPVAAVVSPRHLASSLHVTWSSSHIALATPCAEPHPSSAQTRGACWFVLFSSFCFSFTDSLSLTCIPSCSLFHHTSTLSRSPSPCVCHALPLCLSRAATSPRAAPRYASPIVLPRHHSTRFRPAVNGGDGVVGGRAGWSVSAGAVRAVVCSRLSL